MDLEDSYVRNKRLRGDVNHGSAEQLCVLCANRIYVHANMCLQVHAFLLLRKYLPVAHTQL